MDRYKAALLLDVVSWGMAIAVVALILIEVMRPETFRTIWLAPILILLMLFTGALSRISGRMSRR